MNMMDSRCACLQCLHPSCPLPHAESPYDEVSHEIDNNFISVKVPRNRGKFEPESIHQQEDRLSFDFNCADAQGEKCKVGCTKVHVIPHQYPPAKRPEEEMLSLKTRRHVMPNDNLKNMLEIEFKAARNYIPLPEPGPAPPIIVPRQRIRKKKRKVKGKGKQKRRTILLISLGGYTFEREIGTLQGFTSDTKLKATRLKETE
ncbi:unnamed protein product [Heterotrigona itama]|uniref:Uncharacterized protein n=1 Tax=Heterotrigona itama TaxID=395501 RepID=A0A6V7H002_9HYME|nr:unnamed protein product [Heterotrigona itama]